MGFLKVVLVKGVISCLDQAGGRVSGFPKGLSRCVSPGREITTGTGRAGCTEPT